MGIITTEVYPAISKTIAPVLIDGKPAKLSVDLAGSLRVLVTNTIPISGSVTSDVSDRAGRLLGVVYGSQGAQLKQTATNFNAQVEVAVGGTLVDPRAIRALTVGDAITASQGGTWNVGLSTGANTVGKVDQGTGGASAWKVDGSAVIQPVSGTVTANAGTGTFGVAGGKTNNNAVPGATNVGSLTAIANAAAPSWSEGNLVGLSVDLSGSQRVIGTVTSVSSKGSVTDRSGTITSGGVAQTLMSANAARKYLMIENTDNTNLWFNFTTTAVQGQPSCLLLPNSAFVMEDAFVSTEAISIIGATTAKSFSAKEA